MFNYENNPFINDLNLEIAKSEITCFVGPNGSGKTTLLNILSFLNFPCSGSIVFDEKQYSHKLIDLDEVVIKGDYEQEYTKKLWLLNGLHVCLAYYGLSKGVEYIHQIYENREHKDFVEKINSEYFEAYSLYSEEDDESIKMYQEKINKRFKEKMSKDQRVRVARNPREIFSKSERVQGPLQYLIEKDKDVSAIKVVLDLIFSQEFQEVEGFSKFKDNSLSDGRENFYSSFWGQNQLLSKYISKLGAWMLSRNLLIKLAVGLHARPASEFVKLAQEFEGSVTINHNGNEFDAKSLLQILKAGIKKGTVIVLELDGSNEEHYMEKFESLVAKDE